ncbi:MAG TPA: type IV secretion system DNA-binding domain-containing protein [Candidatus Deferrimicrobiaceae bacterium]|jgi:hypothetical protein
MSFLNYLFGNTESSPAPVVIPELVADDPYPKIVDKNISDSLNLGWYLSSDKNEFQLAKISQKDRATHFYVIGATGSGKTKFLEYLIHQDIEQRNGFAVIDPHGDLIEDIKGFLACTYTERELSERIILVDPTHPTLTVTFNPLERLPNVSVPEQVNELVSAFRKIWSDSWGVRMEDLMRSSMIALGEASFSLADLPHFLTDRDFRKDVLTKVSHPIAQEYFQRFDQMTDRSQLTWIEPVMNKINAFLSDERIRAMFSSSKNSFNFREIMDQQKILLIKLDKGKLKGSSDLLGSLLMAKIQMAAFSRADIPQSRRTPFYLYIDEFQNFASESFSVVLSEARKYGLSLIMAHQTLAQISTELRSLILGNTGMQVFFRINRQDAEHLSKEAFEYSGFEVKSHTGSRPNYWSYREEWEQRIKELQTLSPRCCFAKHKIEGGIIPIQTADIEPAWGTLDKSESEYLDFMKKLPFGMKYLVPRETLKAETYRRKEVAQERREIRQAGPAKVIPIAVLPLAETIETIPPPTPIIQMPAPATRKRVKADRQPATEGKGGQQHKYLQSLIKRMAEEKGFRAIIEEQIPDGSGSVDVGLSRDGGRIACEISMTTSGEHELGNIEKCLATGYGTVILCSAEKRALEKVRKLALEKLDDAAQAKVLFLQPEEVLILLEKEAAKSLATEGMVKGYKVKVEYQAVEEAHKTAKREAVGKVIAQAMKRMRGN